MPKTNLTQEQLKSLLDYNPKTGLFRWRTGRRIGKIAGCIRKDPINPYCSIQIDSVQFRAHRLAWLYMTGEWPKDQLDHINHNKSDNRFSNLREVNTVENARNRKKPVDNTSGCIGVNWHKSNKHWQAKITIRGKTLFLGLYKDLNLAIQARKKAEIEHGFHSNHGSL